MENLIEKLRDDKSLLVCPAVFKNRVLEYLSEKKEVYDIKFIDINGFRENRLFDYDIKAVKYLTDTYGLSVSNAREILNNIYYVEDRDYGNEKLNSLARYRRELEQKGLLIYNRLFDKFLDGRKIIVAGYGELNRSDRELVSGEIISYEEKKKKYIIDSYETIEEEVEHIYNSISDLIRNGTDINNIYILNVNRDYDAFISRFNSYYGFMVAQDLDEKLLGTTLAQEFLEMIDELNRQEIYNRLAVLKNDAAGKLINIINKYTDYDLKDVKDFIVEDLKNTSASVDMYSDVVKCADMYTPFEKDDHVFLIGFNDQFPVFRSDSEYITNNLRPLLGMSTVEEENELIRRNTRGYLSGIENLHISYCEKSPFKKYNLNNLFTDDEYEIKKGTERSYDYSEGVNRLKYAYMQDRMQKYSIVDEDYSLLQKEYGKNDYMQYSNLFKGLSKQQTDQLRNIKLSYTKINDYYLCRFRYFLDYVMKILDSNGNYNTIIGNICHEVLKDLYTDQDFDFERSWEKALRNEESGLNDDERLFADEAEEFFADKIKEELREDLRIIEKQKQMTVFDRQLCEEYIKVDLSDNVSFDGKIDKVMYKEGKNSVVADVIDYKTGSSSFIDRRLMEYGLSLQLPSYMYLLSRKDLFDSKQLSYGGFYLQHLINTDRKYIEDETLEDKKMESMKLEGFTTDDLDRLEICDPELGAGQSSRIYRNLKKKNDGTLYATSNTMSDSEIEEKIELVEKKIREAADGISNGKFEIDPKKVNNKNISCDYCPFADICYRRFVYDIRLKETKDDGGEMD